MASKNPQTVTVYGRLSWPQFELDKAIARNATSKYPQDADKVTAEFNLLLDDAQLKKFRDHVRDEFLPWCQAQLAAGETKNVLDAKQVELILKVLDSDLEVQPPYIPIKAVPEKSQALCPEAVAMLKVKGPRGQDIELKAVVNDEDEMIIPDPDQLTYPCIKPIGITVHKMYGGAYVGATLNLYAFTQGKMPGFSASAGVAVFRADAERFGGGVAVDEEEMFVD